MMQSNRKRVGILFGSLNNGNMGVQALTYSLLSLLDQAAHSMNVEFDYVLFDCAPVDAPSRDVTIGENTIPCQTILYSGMGKKLWFRKEIQNTIFPAWNECDLIFDLCGGDSFSDIYGPKRFLSIFFTHFNLHRMKVPILMPPQTVGPFKRWWVRNLAKRIMTKAVKIYSRDKQSSQYVRDLLPTLSFREFPDIALFMPYTPREHQPGTTAVGINVSGLLWNGGYTNNNQFDLQCDYQSLVKRQMDYFSQQPDVKIHLIPHVITPSMPVENDVHACEQVAKAFPDAVVAPVFQTPIEAKSYISGMDFFTGSRMHSAIAAISTGVPVCPVAYSRKFVGLFRATLGYQPLADITTIGEDEAMEHIQTAFENRVALREEIATIGSDLAETHKALLGALCEDIAIALGENG